MNKIEYLIISNTIDYSTDLVCIELEKLGQKYFRLNRDKLSDYDIYYNLNNKELRISNKTNAYLINSETLKAVYFRAPVFLRNHKPYNLNEQLYRSQWNSFIRNLIVFDNCKWVNHPVDTYKAENKLFQLKVAEDIGFAIPNTIVANVLPEQIKNNTDYIIKSLDTALFYHDEQELFTYSTKLTNQELLSANLNEAPVIIQECLNNKIDLRVTIVEDYLLAVSIKKNGCGIDGDWRKTSKENLEYEVVPLPLQVESKIRELMKKLNLKFGGMDLILQNNEYYFIEVNPTGEWGWLKYATNHNIDVEIVNCLTSKTLSNILEVV